MYWIRNFINQHWEGILYIFYGGLTTLVSWGSYALFVLVGIDFNISNWLSVVCALVFAFVVNKWMVFKSHSPGMRDIAIEFAGFTLFRAATILFRLIAFPVLITLGMDQSLFGVHGFIALMVVTVVETIINYLTSKFIVFRKNKEKENA
ncbi:MAG: GtrA family protein [Candidatus Methanoplasma sp.]|nr:GtrA family protein [Candidatus Methanoplasma sp.]